jgi:CheY-like chemotaxis protein
VGQAVETSRPLIDAAHHRLIVELPAEPLVVNVDLARMSQVFANLLNNAAKYTPPGGDIALAVEARGGTLRVAVRDTGMGIPPEMLGHVFEMFTQVDRSLERARGGLGIGLSVAKRLVEMHGGSIEAHSAGADQGSEFVVTLRLAPTSDQRTAPHSVQDTVFGELQSRRVLVADDNEDAANTLASLLQLMGSEVRIAHDGNEALAAADLFRPEIVLLDIGMPGLTGHDVCRRIRAAEWGRSIVIAALTGWGQEADRRKSREAGFDHHLVKPVEVEALHRILSAPLPRSSRVGRG